MHLLPLPHATPLPSSPLPSPALPCMCLCVCVVVWLLVSTVSRSYIVSFLLHCVARPSGTAMPSALLPKPPLHVPPQPSDLSIHKGTEKSPFQHSLLHRNAMVTNWLRGSQTQPCACQYPIVQHSRCCAEYIHVAAGHQAVLHCPCAIHPKSCPLRM